MGETASRVVERGVHAQKRQVTLLTTGHRDAVLHEAPPERTAHTMGRPRVVGSRLPSPEQILHDPQTTWQHVTLEWDGQGQRTLEG